MVSYWPHVAIVIGVSLNIAGSVLVNPLLLATGTNLLTVGGLYLTQRRRNTRRDDS